MPCNGQNSCETVTAAVRGNWNLVYLLQPLKRRVLQTFFPLRVVLKGSMFYHFVTPFSRRLWDKLCDRLHGISRFRVHFLKKIQDWIFKSRYIRKQILRFFTEQINIRSLRSWCIKGTEESLLSSGFFGSFDAP